jgi:hypothetical protein
MLCQAHDEAEDIRRAISIGEVPRFYKLPNGSFVTHLLVVQLKDSRTRAKAWLASIGFSPSDRSRLGIVEVRVRDELHALAKGRVSPPRC